MSIKYHGITDKLTKVRESMGAQYVPFVPNIEIDETLPAGSSIEVLFHPSGLLVRRGRPVVAYIRDHTFGVLSPNPVHRKKIHFTVCATLKSMKRQGRFERYRVITRDDNRYPVDIGTPKWGIYKEVTVSLYPCQYCLGNVGYKCFHVGLSQAQKQEIVKSFDAKEAFSLLRQQFSIFKAAMEDSKSALLPSGYPRNWRSHSREFRQTKDFTCEQCGVRLRNRPELTDAHHKIPDKSDIRYDNLACLCKLCHQEHHPHYKVPGHVRYAIEAERRSQGISS